VVSAGEGFAEKTAGVKELPRRFFPKEGSFEPIPSGGIVGAKVAVALIDPCTSNSQLVIMATVRFEIFTMEDSGLRQARVCFASISTSKEGSFPGGGQC